MKMASTRKVDSGFFDQRWVGKLAAAGEPQYILLFLYLVITCRNPVGLFEVDSRTWNFKLNPSTPFKDEDVFSKFGKRIRRIEGHPDKGIIVGFCDFQRNYGQQSKQWQWVEKDLAAVGLTYEDLLRFDEESTQPEFDLGMPPPLKKSRPPAEPKQRNIIPPKIEWVEQYCAERKNGISPQAFFNWAESKGWKVGKEPMKDWQAAVRTWEERRKAESPASAAKTPVQNIMSGVRRKF